jgi:hypothetical protein
MRMYLILTAIISTAVIAQENPVVPSEGDSESIEQQAGGVKTLSGMSILGNEEAPKSLVIVPWKSSRLGDGLGISNALDQSPRAVDKEVFMRELHFFELRSGGSD